MPDRDEKEALSKRSEAQRRSWRDPEVRRRRIAGLRRRWRSAEYRSRVKEAVRRWAASPTGRQHLAANGKRTILLGRPGNPSRPERAMAALLRRRGIPFAQHQRFGKYTADFVIGDLVLEVDDPRFHGSAEVRERDARKDAFLSGKGYVVRRISAVKVLRAVIRAAKGDRLP